MSNILKNHEDKYEAILNALENKLKDEEDIEKMGYLILEYSNKGKEISKEYIDKCPDRYNDKVISFGIIIIGEQKEFLKNIYGRLNVARITTILNNEVDISKIGNFFISISNVISFFNIDNKNPEIVDQILESIEVSELYQKVNHEKNLKKIGIFISGISRVVNQNEEKILKLIDLRRLKRIVEEETDIEKIGFFLNQVSKSFTLYKSLIENIDMSIIINKINNESDLDKINVCIDHITDSKNKINTDNLINSIKNEKDLSVITEIFKILSDNSVIKSIVSGINFQIFLNKLKDESDIETIGIFIEALDDIDMDYCDNLCDKIDMHMLKYKVEKQNDIEKIAHFLSNMFMVGAYKLQEKLTKNLDIALIKRKIDKEENPKKVSECIWWIYSSNQKVGKILLEIININKFKLKIVKEDDPSVVSEIIERVPWIHEEIGEAIEDFFKEKNRYMYDYMVSKNMINR